MPITPSYHSNKVLKKVSFNLLSGDCFAQNILHQHSFSIHQDKQKETMCQTPISAQQLLNEIGCLQERIIKNKQSTDTTTLSTGEKLDTHFHFKITGVVKGNQT